MPSTGHDVIGLLAGAAVGGYAGNKMMPGPVLDIDIPLERFMSGNGGATFNLIKRPGIMAGATVGAILGLLAVRMWKKRALASLAQAQPTNSGTIEAAITWANGYTEKVATDDVVRGEDLMAYMTENVLDIAEMNFGNQAPKMFPAMISMVHGDAFYHGRMTIDEEGFPELMLENTSVKRPAYLAKNADRKNARRDAAAQEAINEVNAGRIRVQPGEPGEDFTMPIPTYQG